MWLCCCCPVLVDMQNCIKGEHLKRRITWSQTFPCLLFSITGKSTMLPKTSISFLCHMQFAKLFSGRNVTSWFACSYIGSHPHLHLQLARSARYPDTLNKINRSLSQLCIKCHFSKCKLISRFRMLTLKDSLGFLNDKLATFFPPVT